MNISKRNGIVFGLLASLFIIGLTFLNPGDTYAATNIFPAQADFGDSPTSTPVVRSAVANYSPSSGYFLDAPTSSVRLYIPPTYTSNTVNLTIYNAGRADGIGDAGGIPTTWTFFSLGSDEINPDNRIYQTRSDPGGNGNITLSLNIGGLNTMTAGAARHEGYKVIEIEARANGGAGWNTFYYQSSGGTKVTYFKLTGYDKFALKANPGTPPRDFSLRFAPDCDVTGNEIRILRYFDADAGVSNQGGQNPVITRLIGGISHGSPYAVNISATDPNPASPTHPLVWGQFGQHGNGGDNDPGDWHVPINPDRNYVWQWQNIYSSNGIQFGLPFDGINYDYDCPPPPQPQCGDPGQPPCPNAARCNIFAQIGPNPLVSGTPVIEGTPVSMSVQSRNMPGSTNTWERPYRVYFHEGVPSAGAPEGLGRVHKYGTNPAPPNPEQDFNHRPLGPGQQSDLAPRGVNTSVVGPQTITYTVNHLLGFSGTGVPQWEELARCTFVLNVVPQPYEPDGQIISASCSDIVFTATWQPFRPVNLNIALTISYPGGSASKNMVVAPGANNSVSTFNDPSFMNVPMHLNSYTITLTVNDNGGVPQYMGELSISGAPCMSMSCSPQADYEAGSPTPYSLTYRVVNNTQRPDNRYAVAIGASTTPPNGAVVGATLNTNGASTDFIYNYNPNDGTTAIGDLRWGGASTGLTASCLVTVVRYPYIKAYGADVMAGGGFGPTCNTVSGIFARMRPLNQHNTSSNKSGSGSQLGSFAWADIEGFASASLRNTTPAASGGNRLHFAGQAFSSTSQTPDMGGNLGGNPVCLPDYYNVTQYPTTNTTIRKDEPGTNIGQSGITDNGRQIFYNGTVTLDINGNYQGKRTYYVNGDLRIEDNVIYGPYGNIADIPNFTVIVRGNIYISPAVTQLDGIYIAQPDPARANTGRIYTCATASTPHVSSTAAYSNCSGGYGVAGLNTPRLTVNGSFIAQKVVLNRSVNTLSNSTYQEPQATSSAAEVFNFTPEVILSPPIFRPSGGPTSGDYQAIAVLPPIL